MDRINSANMAVLNPGARRGWQNLIPGTQLGTQLDEAWFNDVQEELLAFIEGTGLVPSATAMAQVLQAINRLTASNLSAFNANAVLTADNSGIVLVDATNNSVTLTLPAASSGNGAVATVPTSIPLRFTIIRNDTQAANTVTITPAGSDLFNWPGIAAAATSFSIPPGGRLTLIGSGGTPWRIGNTPPLPLNEVVFPVGVTQWTVPPGAWLVHVRALGGGGGGGGAAATSSTQNSAAAGGNSGCYGEGVYPVAPGQVITVTVGAGGAGGAAAAGSGGNGATTSFGSLLSCPGGYGGPGSAAAAPPFVIAPMGPGSIASGGRLNGSSASGAAGMCGQLNNTIGGAGGFSLFGGAGMALVGGIGGGNAFAGLGGGGSGAACWASNGAGSAGGNGGSGTLIVEW